jgi:ubiquinone/menaquinone biosynthesis C-methylase UbiE
MKDIEMIWNLMTSDYEYFTNKDESFSNLIEWPCIKQMLPVLKNKTILDIGCGTGRFSFHLDTYEPKSILGIDIAKEMIALAQYKNKSNRIIFKQSSVEKLSEVCNIRFDFIFSSTATHYFSDLRQAFRSIYGVLEDNGVVIISAMHPLYTAQYPFTQDSEWKIQYLHKDIREYYQPWTKYGKSKNGVICKSFHYTFSDYINGLIEAGFEVKEIQEPSPPIKWKETNKERYEDLLNVPIFFVIKCVKRNGAIA